MAGVVSNSGEICALQNGDQIIKLCQTDVTPAVDSTTGDFVEADFENYSAITLDGTSWGSPATDGAGAAVMTYGEACVFTSTDETSQDIYGRRQCCQQQRPFLPILMADKRRLRRKS
ncbi:hypothetical protein M4951_16460 [Blastopirellula sp. J2-11]|uniref:hypothetical protein n=1 Tax=Blastopirellula sp. J2-11 TaxID=2943192 RepID=UPI0021C5B644|nr:hypothetical protein [Blastopirellula sp. J2-11]UUO04973.1 hypothetical protein M4951_16460 [Blastopirellula sp. J2-11]